MAGARLGKRTTAEEALRGASLQGKNAVVTGASSGIGVETARVLAKAGANVLLAVRNVQAGEQVRGALQGSVPGRLSVAALDLSDLASVRRFTDEVRSRGEPLHLLLNNAGVMAAPLQLTAQGFESQLGTNHLGHFLLTLRLLPLLAQGARVVTVSSGLHTRGTAAGILTTLSEDPRYEKRPYSPFRAYGDAKLANVLFAKALARRLPADQRSFALHPGVIATRLSRHMGIGGALFRLFGKPFLKSVPQGAATSIFAATAPELGACSGAYLQDCAVARPSAEAEDPALAEKVWEASERAVAAFSG